MIPLAKTVKKAAITLFLFTFSLYLAGCTTISSKPGSADQKGKIKQPKQIVENVPYTPTEFKDLLIPGELKFNNEKTMSIHTDSFAGGILNFSGRVEMNSLADFFTTTMQKNGWKLGGTIQHKEILLAFVKPHKTCMIRIIKSGFGLTTEVFAYITEDVAALKAGSM